MFKQRRNQDNRRRGKEFATPLEELAYLMDELEATIRNTNADYIESISPPPLKPKGRTSLVDSLRKLRRGKTAEEEVLDTTSNKAERVAPETHDDEIPDIPDDEVPEKPKDVATPQTPSPDSSFRSSNDVVRKEVDAKFIPMDESTVDRTVEIVRRIAELVVFGERAAGSAEEQKLEPEDEDTINAQSEQEKYIAIFEHFFERNGLELITNILSGRCFDLETSVPKHQEFMRQQVELTNDVDAVENMIRDIDLDQHDYMLLPPLQIATQAIQSVSILVQNVKRAMSLYFILSNNYVNQLINFPLEQYHIAERKKHNQENNMMSPRRFGSPLLAELTTHYITFLKSLALRVNTETLQFFLTYPTEIKVSRASLSSTPEFLDNDPPDMDADEERPLDEVASNSYKKPKIANKQVKVVEIVDAEFPLYERALEFCSAHQDSFVRLTAMNICLNIIRLPTVRPTNDETDDGNDDRRTGSSPDGVLYNAEALPLKERLAIAKYVSAPSRVERLASPIFTKLAQIFLVLEEQFRERDAVSYGEQGMDDKVARAKEMARRKKSSDSFGDTSYNLQDELLLLEDLLKVGLTSLNEQVIEMMFATFVYPLLLQPLLVYFQRSPVSDVILFADQLNDHSDGIEMQDSYSSQKVFSEKSLISAPAKSAFFSLAAVFQFISNPPLLRLLFTALLHPLSPGSTGEKMIRASADVACIGSNGEIEIRMDPVDENGNMKLPTDRSTYDFGKTTGRMCASGSTDYPNEDDTCIFVLSPALAEVLEFKGDDGSLIARTRHNPYRKATFQCFTLSSHLSDLQNLSILAVDSALSLFDEQFVADILLGLDLKRYEKNLPAEEKRSGSHLDFDDRGIGGGVSVESRLALGGPTGGKLVNDPMNEVLSSFRTCLMKAVPGGGGTWKLEYDLTAAHALLCAIRGNTKALQDAATGVDTRCRQAAAFLSDMPKAIDTFGGKKLQELVKGSAGEWQNDVEAIPGTIMDLIFRGYDIVGKSPSLFNDLLELKAVHRVNDKPGHSVSISNLGSYNTICSRACYFPPLDVDGEALLRSAMSSARAWAKLDAFSTFLKSLTATKGWSIRKRKIGGFAAKRDGSVVDINDQSTVYAPISESSWSALFDEDHNSEEHIVAQPGSVVSLVGRTAFPCVCEVPPSSAPLFSEAGAMVVSQGITWQSLYLVLLGSNLVFAEPERSSSGNGRVVTCCKLERLKVERDPGGARRDTSARRLILSHDGSDVNPPGLFLFEETPSKQEVGPLIQIRQSRSSLDVWFEDSKAVELAFKRVAKAVDKAKASRGNRIRKYLAQGEDSGYPPDIPEYRYRLEDAI